MNRRLSPLLLIPILVVWLALPRDSAVTSEAVTASVPAGVARLAPSLVTGAPRSTGATTPSAGVTSSSAAGAPKPSGGIGEPASYCKPQFCETPQPRIVDGISGEATWWNTFGGGFYVALRPDLGSKGDLVIVCGPITGGTNGRRHTPRVSNGGARGDASGAVQGLRRDLRGDGRPAHRDHGYPQGALPESAWAVSQEGPFHCVTAPVITSCACLGPNSERLVDLSRDLFAEFADPSLGVVRVVIQVVRE